ncbi:MAG: penicillin acylase family protein [Deltaproteobacteria bacterium]|nr:penicillin acylase family protein [Deltaproteobacteria bacterium]
MKKLSIILTILLSVLVLTFFFVRYLNNYKTDGVLHLSKLEKNVKLKRDNLGVPYIYGKNLRDLIRGQGFATAQDRLFQMHLAKFFATGRISEIIGQKGIKSDTKMRTLGFLRNAKKHLKILDKESIDYLKNYAEGVNAYINSRKSTHHLEFKLAGVEPEKWKMEDSLSILYYMGWGSAANLKTEIISTKIIDKVGLSRFRELLSFSSRKEVQSYSQIEKMFINKLDHFMYDNFSFGSNSWITGSRKSLNGKPILSNDPHLDTRMLPGPWYPSVLISDKIRVAGVTLAGVPGIFVGRNKWVTCGITNSYGDAQDLYIERVNPLNSSEYLEGSVQLPFVIINEAIKIKNGSSYTIKNIKIRLTKRGPVISDVLNGFNKKIITVRWAPYESMGKNLGLDYLLKAKTFNGVRKILKSVSIINLNFLIADKNGNIGFQTTGKIPIRRNKGGSLPTKVVNSIDNWKKWIPFDEMPHEINSKRDWIGNGNHKTVPPNYPYYYSSYYSPYYRYQRISELLSSPGKKSREDHFRFQHDTHNIMARRLVPVFTSALLLHPETQKIGKTLNEWDFEDSKDSVGASIFHELYKNLAVHVFRDELGPINTKNMLNLWYFWQEKYENMLLKGNSKWFDNSLTYKIENLETLIQSAGLITIENLTEKFGEDIEDWRWSEMHTITFTNPLIRDGFFKDFFGTGKIPYSGSVETLQRGSYSFSNDYDTTISASMRMVSDLSDDDKLLLIIAGGVSGRTFSPHFKDQIKPFVNGEKSYIYFSDRLIDKNIKSVLTLKP